MKKVRYIGDVAVLIPSLSVVVEPGDEIEVPDEFENASFTLVKKAKEESVKNV